MQVTDLQIVTALQRLQQSHELEACDLGGCQECVELLLALDCDKWQLQGVEQGQRLQQLKPMQGQGSQAGEAVQQLLRKARAATTRGGSSWSQHCLPSWTRKAWTCSRWAWEKARQGGWSNKAVRV
ncbi:hypothetical protein HaLaN_10138 [Haematococcus lacustris]|uniref:Uncharacterized protein n=1 Tax=Haematococcus lacustris TaxID=44745 RepID=A0A699YX22_HAELA|nr:hypothetical protein HaLaN_10138 [Haematococcus lacustris]